MTTIYLAAVAFGVTLLAASLLLGGKDTDHGDGGDADVGLAWAPVGSMRFWVFLLAFGGGAGYALTKLGSGSVVSAIGAAAIGWAAGSVAVLVVRKVTKASVSTSVEATELVGTTGTLLLPVGKDRPGKVRVELKGKAEDFVATIVDDGVELPSGAQVLIVAEGERGSLLVSKAEM
ncbi:MAG: hypothetical protein AB7T06_28405 [Kofleriaceae bacterium]